MNLKIGDLVKIIYAHPSYVGKEAVVSSFHEDFIEVILMKRLSTIQWFKEDDLDFISSGHQQVIEQRNAEIEKLKEIERLKKLAYLPVDPDSVIHPVKDSEGRIKS